MRKKAFMCFLSLVLASGCAVTRDSILTGLGTGAALGMGGGMLVSKHNEGKVLMTSALIGAGVGGLGGYLLHRGLQKRDSQVRKETLFNLDKYSVSTPSQGGKIQDFKLSSPDVHKECFDWEVKGDKLVQKHCVWTIKSPSFWVSSE